MYWLQMQSWSPYVIGAAMGVLSWFTFVLSDKFLSCSTTYSRLSGMIERRLRGPAVEQKAYYRKTLLIVDWQFMFVIGILIGAFLSAFLSDSLHLKMVPELWRQHFGDTPVLRFFVAFAGGVLMFDAEAAALLEQELRVDEACGHAQEEQDTEPAQQPQELSSRRNGPGRCSGGTFSPLITRKLITARIGEVTKETMAAKPSSCSRFWT